MRDALGHEVATSRNWLFAVGSTASRRVAIIAAAVVVGTGGVIASGGGGIDNPQQGGGGGGSPPPACTQTFTTATIGTSPYPGDSVNTALQNGTGSTVLCFASGTYSELVFYDAVPSGVVLMRPADGASVSGISFNMNGVSNVKIDGFQGSSSTQGMTLKQTGASTNHDVTFSNNSMTSAGVVLRDSTNANANIKIEDNSFVGFTTSGEQTRMLVLSMNSCPNGVTIQRNVFGNGQADGLDLSGASCGTIIQDNEFYGILQANCGAVHCDGLQDNGGSVQTVIRRNFFHDIEDGTMAFDGTGGGWSLVDNVFENIAVDNVINLGGDSSSTIEHNTIIGTSSKYINFGSKAAQQSTNETVRNNISPGGIQSNGAGTAATYTVNDYQLCAASCTGANSIVGTPTFVAGASPATYAGAHLTAGSTGHLAASDGLDMGIR